MSNVHHYSAIRSIELNLGEWDQIKNTEQIPLGAQLDSLHFYKGPLVFYFGLLFEFHWQLCYVLGPRYHQSISFRLVPQAMQGWKLCKNNGFIRKTARTQAEVTCVYPQGLLLDVGNNISSAIHKHSLSNCHNLHWWSYIISVLLPSVLIESFLLVFKSIRLTSNRYPILPCLNNNT